MKIWCGPVLLAVLQSIVVLAHNNNTTDRHLKKTVSNSILHKLRKRANSCLSDEYYTGTYCCKFCNPGTYAQADCNVEHGHPECKDCNEGVTYMDRKNGYNSCQKCSQCDIGHGQKELQACTVFKNTECKCAENFFCTENRTKESESCMHCTHCTLCEDGYAEVCTANKDAVCKAKRHHLALLAVPILLICICCFLTLKLANTCNRRSSDPKKLANTRNRRLSDPKPIILPDDLKDIDLANYLSEFSETMELNTVLLVVRKMNELPAPRIDDIQQDYKNQSNEQKYHLLKEWYESHGRNGAFQQLITTLQQTKKQQIAEHLIEITKSHQQKPQD